VPIGRPQRNPRRHGAKLRRDVETAIEAQRPTVSDVTEGVDPRLVFKVRASSRLADSAFTTRHLDVLGETEDWTYFAIARDPRATALIEALEIYSDAPDEEGARARLESVFGVIDAIEPYGPEDRMGPGLSNARETMEDRLIVDAELWPSPDQTEATVRVEEVTAVADLTSGRQLDVDYRPQSTAVRVDATREGVDALLSLPVVERLVLPLAPLLDPSDWVSIDAVPFEVADGAPIGILDDGVVTGHPLLDRVVASQDAFPGEIGGSPLTRHGSMVAGLASFGGFESGLAGQSPLVGRRPIHVARVLEPTPDGSATRFAEGLLPHHIVEEAIRTLSNNYGVRIFNLSFAYPFAFAGPNVSVMTELVDRLARELDLVIVICTGNVVFLVDGGTQDGQSLPDDYPTLVLEAYSRVAEPGVASLGVSVGSIAHSAGPASASGISRAGEAAVAGVDEVSPFSRSGPGVRRNAVKPDFVDYGGNFVMAGGQIEPQNPGVDVVSTWTDGSGRLFSAGSGTSFSTPRVAHVASRILATYPQASANLVRALLGLSASIPQALGSQFDDDGAVLRVGGYGLPQADRAVESGGNRVVLVYEGGMPVDSVMIHPLPIPSEFVKGTSERSVRIALAFDPPVRRQRREYLGARMRLDLLRGVDVDTIRETYSAQDPDDPLPLLTDRRRVTTAPGPSAVDASTLHVRTWKAMRLNPDDGDEYFVVVTHRREPWASSLAEDYESQRYALAVEYWDLGRPELNLYERVEQVVRTRVRVRAGG
jgi:hypothetical protein